MSATKCIRLLATVLLVVSAPMSGRAQTLVASDIFHVLENRAANNVGVGQGIRQTFGASSVTPNGGAGTIGLATSSAGVQRTLIWSNDPTSPNFFNNTILANQNNYGPWTLEFTNPNASNSPLTVLTPDLYSATVMPFVNSVSISGTGTSPTFNWTIPPGTVVDGVRINIRDTSQVNSGGAAVNIFSRTFSGPITSFTVNPSDPGFLQPLVPGREYSIEIGIFDLRDGTTNLSTSNFLSRSRAFFNFTLTNDSLPDVYLPTLVTGDPAYHFNISEIAPGQTIFIDPLVAIGYDYQIGSADPNFLSVVLPTGIGDDMFDLWLWNGTSWYDPGIDLESAVPYSFGPDGVDRFRILGIELSAGLDPFDVTAFVTGLTFNVQAGQFATFTGTMTPITAAVPEPASLALVAIGFALLVFARRRRSQR